MRPAIVALLALAALLLLAGGDESGYAWVAPAALDSNAGTDSGNDHHAQVTTDGVGNWVAVWDSDEPNVGSGF